MNELYAARSLLRETEPMNWLRDHDADRYIYLETIVGRSYFDEREAFGGGLSKQGRRDMIAKGFIK